MDDRMDESLPSHSNFHTDDFENSNSFRGSRASRLDNGYPPSERNGGNRRSQARPESPPPPPPPLRQSMDQHNGEPFNAPLTAPKRKPVEKPANGAFPFLKRGSRKEPSSMHRINSPTNKGPTSPSSESGFAETGDSKKFQSSKVVINHGPAYDERNVTSKIQNHSTPSPNYRNSHRGFNDDGEEIVLMGQSYNKTNSPMKRDHNSDSFGPLKGQERASTVSINGDDWRRALQANDTRTQAHREELDEFENIEMQLQTLKMSSTGKSEFTVTSRTAATRSYSQDHYSDEEDRDDHRASSTKQQPQKGGGSYLSNYEKRSFDAGDTASSGLAMLSRAAALRPSVHGNRGEDTEEEEVRDDRRPHHQYDDEDEYELDYDKERYEGEEEEDGGYDDNYTLQGKQRAAMRHSEFDKYDGAADIRPHSRDYGHAATTSSAALRPSGDRFGDTASWGAVTQPVAVDSSINSFNSKQQPPNASSSIQGKSVLAGSTLRKLQKESTVSQSNTGNRQSLAGGTGRAGGAVTREEEEGVRVVRPVSSLHQTAPAPLRPKGTGAAASSSSSAAAGGQKGGGEMPKEITEKARELEAELETYRSENANLKKLRKQHEATLQEVIAQKEEVIKWSAEEKAKVNAWCEQQRNALAREKRAMAKQASESRAAGSTSIRKEKAEIEALQATIEKMKVDHEQASKKWKTNEARLNGLIKEHTLRLEEQSQILINLENDKLMLMEYISQQGLRVPKNLKSQLQESHKASTASKGSGPSSSSKRSAYAPDGYVEEVEVQMVKSSSRTIPASGASSHAQLRQSSNHRDSRDSDVNTDLANAVFQRGGQSKASQSQGLHQTMPGDVFNHLSNNIHAGSAKSRTMSSASQHRSPRESDEYVVSSSRSRDTKGGPSGATSGRMAPDASTNSWGVRSSRSSTSGGRYDETHLEAEDVEDAFDEDDDVGLAKYSSGGTYGSSSLMGTINSKKYSETNDAVRLSLTREKTSPRPPSAGTTATSSAAAASSAKDRTLGATSGGEDGAGGTSGSNRIETILEDGSRMIQYRNGTKKKVSADGLSSVVMFANGDSKHTQDNGLIVYYYSQADTTHTTFPDGTEVYEFPNGQIEKHLTSGVKQIEFPDKTRKVILTNGLQESYFPDGMILREYPDGQKEVITEEQATVYE